MDQAVAAVSQPCADFPKSNQGERRGNSARIAGYARPGKTSPNRPTSRGRRAAPGRPRPRGSSATTRSRPLGRYGRPSWPEPVSQLSPYRRDRSVVGEDRTETGRATGNDRLPSRLPTAPNRWVGSDEDERWPAGTGTADAAGGSHLERASILARAPGEAGLNSEKDNPQEPRPGGRRANPPAPGRLGPWGSSAPRGTPTAFPSLARESLVLRPEGRLNLTAATAGCSCPPPSGSPSGPVGPSGRSSNPDFPVQPRRPLGATFYGSLPRGSRQGDGSAGQTHMPS
jgi:hypothetical protein